jgi:serine/threonine protein kinase
MRIEANAEPIPGYRLIERLGGLGEVWKAEPPGGNLKAIKIVHGDLDALSDDGQRVVQQLMAIDRVKKVRHSNILSLDRYDVIDGRLLIVMDLADRTLWDRFRDCRAQGLIGIPREELLKYMEETAAAIDLVNIEHDLQHLDIKPQHLFLVRNHVKVADFGLCKSIEGVMVSVTVGGTPGYAAPETFDGWVSRFCDQYSLAVVYQELLTNKRPFSGTSIRQIVLQHLKEKPDLSTLSPADRVVVARALSKYPDQRFPTCQAFVRALRNPAAVAPPPAPDLETMD